MQKSILFSLLSAAIFFCGSALAESAAPYTRKQLKPNFFIPANELDHTEKLPKFNYYPPIERQKNANLLPDDAESADIIAKAPVETTPKTEQEAPNSQVAAATAQEKSFLPDTKPALIQSEYIEYDKNELAKIPEYKQKYADYINDLKVIAETGQAPENPRVVFDLAKMNSNKHLIVTDKFGLKPDEPASKR